MKKHLLILFSYTAVLLCSELAHRLIFGIPPLARIAETAAIILAVCALYYFARYKLTRIFLAFFFSLSVIINNIHYEIYESWINSTNYLLALTEITEVATAGSTMLGKVLPTLLWGTVETLVFISIARFRPAKHPFPVADCITLLFFLYMFIRAFTTNNDIGLTPRTNYSRLKANTFAFTSFIGRTIPYETLQLSGLPNYTHPIPNITESPKIRNIIFIVGESLSAKHIHHFGYPRPTTPFLDHFANHYPNAVLKRTYAAGLGTAISLPALFNAVPHPNGLTHIVKGNTNLFHLAQRQGFKTEFHSSQPEWEMEILGLMGKKWIDTVTFPTQKGFSVHEGMNDHQTLPYLYQTDFSQGRHFFILHHRGSHVPYGKYLTGKHFPSGSILDDYDSTVYDTDDYIKKVFEFLSKQDTKDWLLVYTSDHGQNVSNEVYNHGTVAEGTYSVPTMIYTPDAELQRQIHNRLAGCDTLFHQQLATNLISLMGYDMPPSDCHSGVINSNLLTGNSGYLKVENGKMEFVYPNARH